MPKALVNGVNLYYEVTGQGFPLVWCHEFAGSYESWDPQVKFFSRRYSVVTYNARGYPPSDVPRDLEAYSVEQEVEDLHGLLRHLGIPQAYVGGLSMGGGLALNFGIAHPAMARALIVAGAGTGTTDPQRFRQQAEVFARRLEAGGMEGMAEYVRGPTRVQLLRKSPKAWEEFAKLFMAHSPVGSALTFRGVQGRRRGIYELEASLRKLGVPTLILVGDEDEPCLEPALFMKRCIPRSGLVVLPQSGHAINLEEPELFNRVVLDFLTAVEADRWSAREAGSGVGFLASEGARGTS
ncbi:MAG: alpha/beta hydrolase [Chloroflexi bacterium]|nr:alpha/beta hydrolase [Chloroflexota bacterium]